MGFVKTLKQIHPYIGTCGQCQKEVSLTHVVVNVGPVAEDGTRSYWPVFPYTCPHCHSPLGLIIAKPKEGKEQSIEKEGMERRGTGGVEEGVRGV
jgi:hypothetical protein